MPEAKLLVVEDDPRMQRLLESQLKVRGFEVGVVADGETAIAAVADEEPDLVLLDISLPGIDGLEVCRRVRDWSSVPVILVTAADMPQTKIVALEIGADDFLTKPFHMGELVARIRAVLRRAAAAPSTDPLVKAGGLTIDIAQRLVTRDGAEIRLTKIEFELLTELVRHANKVLTYHHLLRAVWGVGYDDIRPVHVHICNLRRKLEGGPTAHRLILSVPAVGYRFRLDD